MSSNNSATSNPSRVPFFGVARGGTFLFWACAIALVCLVVWAGYKLVHNGSADTAANTQPASVAPVARATPSDSDCTPESKEVATCDFDKRTYVTMVNGLGGLSHCWISSEPLEWVKWYDGKTPGGTVLDDTHPAKDAIGWEYKPFKGHRVHLTYVSAEDCDKAQP